MKRLFLSGALWLYGALLIVQQTAPPTAASESSQTAHLRIYRQRRYLGWNLAPSIYVDDQQVVRVGNGSRVSIRLAAGPHSIRSDDKSSAIALDAKAGQEYFVRVDEETDFWKGHGRLTMLLPEQGGAEYKMQKPLEDDRRIANDLIEADAATPSAK